jgi:hypothetical protein
MKTKASIVVMSHLSDAQEQVSLGLHPTDINRHINFAKYVMLQTKGDLTQEIDPDAMYEEFLNR